MAPASASSSIARGGSSLGASYHPGGVHHGGRVEIDLEVFKEEQSNVERVELQIDCEDARGHHLLGREFVRLDGADVQVVGLKKKS